MSQVILFDLDGTLTESGEGITKCVQYALDKMGIQEDDLDKLRCFVGPPLKEQFMTYCGFDEAQAQQAVEYYRERYKTVGIFENKLYPKIPELLELLKINDKIMGVASSKPETFVKSILEYFEIQQYFQVIVGSQMDGARTDKAEVIEEALQRLHMEQERDKVLMVGDREHDVQGAISCGIQCIGVAYGYGSKEELEQAGAVYIADTVEDLGILASPNDEETTEQVVSVRKTEDPSADGIGAAGVSYINAENVITSPAAGDNLEDTSADDGKTADTAEGIIEDVAEDTARAISQMVAENMTEDGATQLNQVYTHPLLNAWRAVYPVLIPYGTAILMVILVTAYYTWSTIHNQQPEDPVKIAAQVVKTSIFRLIPTSLIAGSAAFFLYRKDERRRKAGFLGKGPDFVWDPPVIWFSVIVLAVACSQLLNDIMNILKLQEIFPGYSNVTGVVTEDQPVWLVILTIGLLAPIMEELVFRGLIFRRLKDWMNPILAIVMSAVLFGIYHGNMVQFIYATLMGVMLAIIYHRTGTLWTAILAHVSANLWSVVGSTWWNSMTGKMTYGFFVGIIIELLLCVIPAYWIFAKNKK